MILNSSRVRVTETGGKGRLPRWWRRGLWLPRSPAAEGDASLHLVALSLGHVVQCVQRAGPGSCSADADAGDDCLHTPELASPQAGSAISWGVRMLVTVATAACPCPGWGGLPSGRAAELKGAASVGSFVVLLYGEAARMGVWS